MPFALKNASCCLGGSICSSIKKKERKKVSRYFCAEHVQNSFPPILVASVIAACPARRKLLKQHGERSNTRKLTIVLEVALQKSFGKKFCSYFVKIKYAL